MSPIYQNTLINLYLYLNLFSLCSRLVFISDKVSSEVILRLYRKRLFIYCLLLLGLNRCYSRLLTKMRIINKARPLPLNISTHSSLFPSLGLYSYGGMKCHCSLSFARFTTSDPKKSDHTDRRCFPVYFIKDAAMLKIITVLSLHKKTIKLARWKLGNVHTT
jgi:hypothetical protein